jgi:hypothetical protein
MTDCEKLLGSEISVSKLIAEEHRQDGRGGECIQDQRLLKGIELQCRQIAEDQRQPSSPDEKLEKHHREQFVEHRPLHLGQPFRFGLGTCFQSRR